MFDPEQAHNLVQLVKPATPKQYWLKRLEAHSMTLRDTEDETVRVAPHGGPAR